MLRRNTSHQMLSGKLVLVAAAWLISSWQLSIAADEKPSDAKPASERNTPKFDAKAVEFFRKKVQPLLKARCFECHSKDSRRLEGGLRLDARPLVLKGGDTGTSAVPGKPTESLLIEAINYESLEMPPKGKLPAGEIAIFKKWIELGLPWSEDGLTTDVTDEEFPLNARRQSHWAWQPIKQVDAPKVSQTDWPRSKADRFIMATLDQHGLKPTPDADRRTLIRRAYFDVIGLPPSPEEVQQFLDDKDVTPAAYEKVVDRLLKSPHFGERWGRHWLDLVRYAETLGHEFDYKLKYAHHYRDYVIRALNDDVPYDQFVTEHVAGDLLTNPRRNAADQTNESILGTGFWWLGELKHSPVDVKGEEASIIDNQLDVFSKTFLGLTVACARCHDHKFDAIATSDYYALAGFMQSSHRQHAYQDPGGRIETAVKQLRAIRTKANDIVRTSLQSSRDEHAGRITSMLLGASEVLFGNPQPGDNDGRTDKQRPDIVFAEFEGEDFEDWKPEGKAFATGPTIAAFANQQPVTGFAGKKLVNSYAANDNLTGTLTSPEFTIERNVIRLLIGGGNFKGKTCANLLIDKKVVRTAVGRNREQLDPHEWNVSEFSGKRAVLQIVDLQKGGWGHINVDQFVFTDAEKIVPTKRPIEVVARERKLDAALLGRWVKALSAEDVESPVHPAWAWKELAKSQVGDARSNAAASKDALSRSSIAAAERVKRDTGDWQKFIADTTSVDSVRVDTSAGESSGTLRDWAAAGWAFDLDGGSDLPSTIGAAAAPEGRYSSARLGKKPRGVLRSPTFTLTKPNLLYRIAGENITVRLIIDGYVMDEYNGLLFGGCKFNVNNPRMHWAKQGGDVANFVGHRAHIEIYDEGDGWVVLDDVRLVERGQRTVEPVSPAIVTLADSKPDSFEAASRSFADQIVLSEDRDAIAGSLPETNEAFAWVMGNDLVSFGRDDKALTKLKSEAAAVESAIPAPRYVLAVVDGFSEDEHVFIRGSHKNLGDVVPRRLLTAIAGEKQEKLSSGSGRLELAKRLLDPSNPFPARVMANRIWHHLFGRGIVASTDNFGVLGQRPTHPELLDHLATQFVEGGWSVKKLIRSLMLTRTYQMDSKVNPAYVETDPQNQWWHRMPIRRLEGEAIRDAMLTVSGRLDRTLLGPPVPVYVTAFMQGRGRPGTGPLDGNGRRSIYTSVNRNFLPPMMLAFDTPIPFTTIGRRTQSNVPAQALILMNDPFVAQQAELWAKRTQAVESGSAEARINSLYESGFARLATKSEIQDSIEFLKTQTAAYEATSNWETDLRAWADLCHVLFNVKEFVFLK
ncbi:MAG: hypothetical protein ACI8P0_000808 [Planctomycetaceae bacterium]|jgi:hypothetical protein